MAIPTSYVRTGRIRLKDLKKPIFLVPLLLIQLAVLISFYSLFGGQIPQLLELRLGGASIALPRFVFMFALLFLLIVIHEAIHAIPMTLFGEDRPGFKLQFGRYGLIAAYATSNCTLPRSQFLVVGLAPFVVISVVSLVLWQLLPGWAPWLYFVGALNVAGSVGDFAMSWMTLRAHPAALCLDTRYEMAIFEPVSQTKGGFYELTRS